MSNIDDLELFTLILSQIINQKQRRKKQHKSKKLYFLIAAIVILVMGVSMITVGDSPIIVTVRDEGNKIFIDGVREGDKVYESEIPEETILYEQAEKIFGFHPPILIASIQSGTFSSGRIEDNTLYMEYISGNKNIYYKFSKGREKYNFFYDVIKNNGMNTYIYKKDSTYIAIFKYRGHYCQISSDIPESDFYSIIYNIVTF